MTLGGAGGTLRAVAGTLVGTGPAIGDVIDVQVLAKGDAVDITIKGFESGATYDFGFDADNAPTALTPYLTVVSEGYNALGVLGTVTRQVYLTNVRRRAYPNHAQLHESVVDGNLVVRCSLSKPIYDDDRAGGAGTSGVDPVLTSPGGWVTNTAGGGQASRAGADIPVANGSTLDYPKAFAQWSRPDRDRLTSTVLRLGALAFQSLGQGQKPVACVKFTAADTAGHTATATVATPTIDSTFGDEVPVVEWLANIDISGFTDDTLVTADFIAYPCIGDAASVFDTAALAENEFTGKTPPQKYVLDVDGSRGYPIAVVDPTAANDTSGTVFATDTSGNRAAAAAAPFKTIHGAMQAIRTFNNTNNGRSNPMGATVYLTGGTHAVIGGSAFIATTVVGDVWTWTVVTPLPGVTTAVLTPDATAGNRSQATKGIKWVGCAFSRSSDAYWLRGSGNTQKFNAVDCTFTDTRTNTYQNISVDAYAGWFVRCTFTRVVVAGNQIHSLRGCDLPEGYRLPQFRFCVGTSFVHANPAITGAIFTHPSAQANDAERGIVAFNKFMKLRKPLAQLMAQPGVSYLEGFALVQNLIECLDLTGEPALYVSADGTTSSTRDWVVAHNTCAGARFNLGYNDAGTVETPHLNVRGSHNALEYYANKGDTFNDEALMAGPNGNRVGNWAIDNGVLHHGNVMERGAFNQRYPGVYSKSGTDASPLSLGFIDDKSGVGGAGLGNYRPAPGSVLRARGGEQMVAFDLDGNPRAAVDAAGCYAG